VFRGTLHGHPVAVKVINGEVGLSTKQERDLLQEAQALMLMSYNTNCLRLHGIVNEQGMLAIVTELAETSMLKLLLEAGDELTTQQRVSLGRQLASAMLGLHSKNIVHRDLKPANVLL